MHIKFIMDGLFQTADVEVADGTSIPQGGKWSGPLFMIQQMWLNMWRLRLGSLEERIRTLVRIPYALTPH